MGAERFLVPQYEEAPISLCPHRFTESMLICPQLFFHDGGYSF
jgi:hypothetical protein